MRQVLSGILVIALILFLNSCNTTDPPPNGDKPTLELTLEDVSCIEAWIELSTTNLQLPVTITLKQFNPTGDTLTKVSILNTQDLLLYIDSLLPNQTYSFEASHSGLSGISSNELNVSTMDTTSHNFTFETFTFGGTAGSSTLYDVAIINENNIWAVGEIYVADTSQNGYTMYNAVHWDGSEWELKRIYYYGSCSAVEYPPLKAIWAFSDTNIVITNGGSIGWFDGNTVKLDCGVNPLLTGAINKIWGSSSSDLYVVGNNGNIVYYNGQSWQRIESGTELNIGDIWGIPNDNGGYNKYLAAVDAMLKIDNNNQLSRIGTEQAMILGSIWGISNRLIYTAGNGVVLYKNYRLEKINGPDVNTIYIIRGQNYNDIFGLSSTFLLLQFNGFNWQYINSGTNNVVYYRLDVKYNFIATVGRQGEKAAVTIMRGNN